MTLSPVILHQVPFVCGGEYIEIMSQKRPKQIVTQRQFPVTPSEDVPFTIYIVQLLFLGMPRQWQCLLCLRWRNYSVKGGGVMEAAVLPLSV